MTREVIRATRDLQQSVEYFEITIDVSSWELLHSACIMREADWQQLDNAVARSAVREFRFQFALSTRRGHLELAQWGQIVAQRMSARLPNCEGAFHCCIGHHVIHPVCHS